MDEFEDFKILERVFFPQEGRGCRIVGAHSMWYAYQLNGPWTKAFGITVEVIPALSDEEFVSAEAKIGSAQG